MSSLASHAFAAWLKAASEPAPTGETVQPFRPNSRTVTPDTIQRRFLETPGQIITTGDSITVRLERRVYSPVLRQAKLHQTTIPWWGGRTLRYEFN